MTEAPKIAVCCIMCNSEFLLQEWLTHYYDIAHVICIAEGATKKWGEVHGFKTPRSTDNTNKILDRWVAKDKLNKIRIVRSDDFYEEKTEQCNAYMNVIPNDIDYIWCADDDELILHEDFYTIKKMLQDRNATYVEFQMLNFFKSFDVIARGGSGWGFSVPIPRIFSYYPNAKWETHRPPTILNEQGVDVKTINPILCDEMNNLGIYCRHYSYIDHKRVVEKLKYYDAVFANAHGIPNYYSEVWLPENFDKWSWENHVEFEKTHSIHPTGDGAFTELFGGRHPKSIIKKLIS